MILIKDKALVSLDVIEEQFLCDLNACKGACCWEGDAGAPVEPEERAILDRIYDAVKPYLLPEGIAAIEEQGTSTIEMPPYDGYSTPLVDGGACAYMTVDAVGIARCGIEQAYRAGKIDFPKPISCHLYPIRIRDFRGVDALEYDRWSICSAACTAGKKEKLSVYEFLKTPIIRKYGQDFYDELAAVAEDWKQQ